MGGLALPRPKRIVIDGGEWAVLVLSLGGGFTLFAAVSVDGDLERTKAILERRAEELRALPHPKA